MKIFHNVSLAEFTSFGTGGPAETLIRIEKTDELIQAIAEANSPIWFLGSGANVLISDKGLPGTTLHLDTSEITFTEDGGEMLAIADAGVEWDELVQQSIAKGKWGFERMSGIPGSVGAAVVGNIAAYGQAVSDTLVSVEVMDVSKKDAELKTIAADELGLDYRFSDFQTDKFKDHIIVRATFKLQDSSKPLQYASAIKAGMDLKLNANDLQERRKIILEARRRIGSLQDKKRPEKTAGSFFRNPLVGPEQAKKVMEYEERGINYEQIKKQNLMHGGSETRVSAAHVLLAAGFQRGQTWGPVRLHPEHVLKIENTGDATSQQIYDVVQEIIKTVKEKLGIDLVPEVRIIGDFDG